MTHISYDYDIPEPGYDRKGFTQTLREMRKGGSVEVPLAKKSSIYSAAKAAGAKVRIRMTDHATIRVWRLDGEAPVSIFSEAAPPAAKAEMFK